MRIIILSRGLGLYSTQSLLRAGYRRGHEMDVVDHFHCSLLLEGQKRTMIYQGFPLDNVDAVIPRIGASVTYEGASVIRQFEGLNIYTLMRSDALLRARDKLRSLQLLAAAGIPVPKTFYLSRTQDLELMISQIGGLPVVIKLLESTHGSGVILADRMDTVRSVIEALIRSRERVIVQEFIEESKGADIRALLVGGQIVATMKRQAMEGDFRSNLHRGATARPEPLTEEEAIIVKHAARVMGLAVAGVDLLRSKNGPLVIEVNASPGLEGIETTTGVDIAGKIIEYVETNAVKFQTNLLRRKSF
ncbi:MAG: RimK family alpha-L-glutamate ligase [Saprospiraceae bacterium]|nr:RimK family alpha-L-glutamate ligase [Saprospiraceae bacterium]